MRIAFCDDDLTERQALCSLLSDWSFKAGTPVSVSDFDSGEALLCADEAQPFDAVILDIYMPGLSGVETARLLRARRETLPIVFLTSSADHYAEGFALAACHYLIKPIDQEKLAEVMRRLCRIIPAHQPVLVVPGERGKECIPQGHIKYIETVRNGVCIHCENGDITLRYPLSAVMEQLDPVLFVQCHRFYVVNLAFIEDEEDDCFILKDGARLLIRREGRREIKEAYHSYFMAWMRGEI